MSQPVALITGITGQDGSFLAEYLLLLGWRVVGMHRRSASPNFQRIYSILTHSFFSLIEGDVCDLSSMMQVIQEIQPTHIFNLAAQSFVPTSWKQPLYTSQTTGMGAVHVFEAARLVNPNIKIYQASSSEMFGLQPENAMQNEGTPFHPRSPYGCAKAYAHQMAVNYRESYGMFIVSGILFNHESERRGEHFVTRKITQAVAKISLRQQDKLVLGNIQTQRDWGFAGDYVKAMVKMMDMTTPQDFVIATGKKHSVQYFVKKAFDCVNLNWENYVELDKKFERPAEIPALCGDATLASRILDWKPQMSLDQLIERMVQSDLLLLK